MHHSLRATRIFRLSGAIALVAFAALTACNPQPGEDTGDSPAPTPTEDAASSPDAPTSSPSPVPESPASPAASSPAIGTYTVDELFEAGSGGCGMTLWSSDASPQAGFLFFNGVDGNMLMRVDGDLVWFTRTAASGDEFYGQQTSQTFVSEDGSITVTVEVTLGEPGEIESVAIPAGTLQVEQNGQILTLPVVGDAGC
jgi:hypothetical protein